MAAGKDETQPVVFDAFVIPRLGIIRVSRKPPVNIVRQRLKSGVPANSVDRLETPRRHEPGARIGWHTVAWRSEEHTSELQSLRHLVCRLLLEKKTKKET